MSALRPITVFLILSLHAVLSLASPTLIIQDGRLMGARGVEVDGALYDVDFRDGTCAGVHGDCSEDHFAFNRINGVFAAQALLDQVFVDSVEGMFDSKPALTWGCGGQYDNCLIMTAMGMSLFDGSLHVDTFVTSNQPTPSQYSDWVVSGRYTLDGNTQPYFDLVWAVWQPAVATVPEPHSLALSVLSLAAVCTMKRRSGRRSERTEGKESIHPG